MKQSTFHLAAGNQCRRTRRKRRRGGGGEGGEGGGDRLVIPECKQIMMSIRGLAILAKTMSLRGKITAPA